MTGLSIFGAKIVAPSCSNQFDSALFALSPCFHRQVIRVGADSSIERGGRQFLAPKIEGLFTVYGIRNSTIYNRNQWNEYIVILRRTNFTLQLLALNCRLCSQTPVTRLTEQKYLVLTYSDSVQNSWYEGICIIYNKDKWPPGFWEDKDKSFCSDEESPCESKVAERRAWAAHGSVVG